ncbi:hypothetical protein ACIBG8_50265 [Nonomuraea sp. NPDC050556]|uniref:hypothetical protein n=1 Tax=Nonomuraea sp. NPDC050556 TaxID=3364369 RepID=UPI0037B84C92
MKSKIFLLGAAAMLAVPAFAVPGQAAAMAACGLVNGGFEEPGGIRGQGYTTRDMPGWHSSARDGLIEVWGPGNRADPMNFTIPADSGSQYIEVNATSNSPVYQDIETVPGSTINWSLAHRARTGPYKRDVMRVRIGGVQQGPDMADGSDAWGHYKGSYTVPAGQTVTRLELVPVSSGTGYPSYGNFVDSVEVTCTTPAPPYGQPAPVVPVVPVVPPVMPLPPVPVVPPAPAGPAAPDAVLSGPVGKPLTGSVGTGGGAYGGPTYTVTDPSKLPPGVTIGSNGTVTGTPTKPGTYRVPVKACDGGNCSQGEAIIVIHDCPEPNPYATP